VLTPTAVHSSSFGVLKTVVLDDQVEAQPLVVPNVNITAGHFQGTTHSVVYVATDNNSIYAVDVTSGEVLLKPNFGPPVVKPLNCHIYNPDVVSTRPRSLTLAATRCTRLSIPSSRRAPRILCTLSI